MRDLLSWNVSLGRWAGVQVRLHFFFVLLLIVVLFEATRSRAEGEVSSLPWYASALGVWVGSVLLHELGHALVARRLGGHVSPIVLWPLGGLNPVSVPAEPRYEIAAAAAGPLVNLFLCAVSGVWLISQGVALVPLLDPFAAPFDPGALQPVVVAKQVFWINLWMILAFNLLPASPLDGGRAMRAALWYVLGRQAAQFLAARVAQVTAVVLAIATWLLVDRLEFALPILMLSGFVFFHARQEICRLRTSEASYAGFEYEPYDAPEAGLEGAKVKSQLGQVSQWIENRREERRQRQMEQEQEEDLLMDEILARLHTSGPDSLSPEDRALLDRVSARYRDRLRD